MPERQLSNKILEKLPTMVMQKTNLKSNFLSFPIKLDLNYTLNLYSLLLD